MTLQKAIGTFLTMALLANPAAALIITNSEASFNSAVATAGLDEAGVLVVVAVVVGLLQPSALLAQVGVGTEAESDKTSIKLQYRPGGADHSGTAYCSGEAIRAHCRNHAGRYCS